MKMTNALKIQKYCTAAANNAPIPPIMPFARKEATAPWTAVQTLTFRPAVKPTIPTIAPLPIPTAAISGILMLHQIVQARPFFTAHITPTGQFASKSGETS